MQQVEDSPSERARSLPLLAAFVALLAIVALVVGLVVLTRSTPADQPNESGSGAAPAADLTLTDEEAIARFKELDALSLEAIRSRDLSMIDEIFTPSGPVASRAAHEITQLIRDGVTDHTNVVSNRTQITSNGADEIQVLETSTLFPCFISEAGEDVTESHKVVRRTVMWVLRPSGSDWLIHDSLLRNDHLTGKTSSCA